MAIGETTGRNFGPCAVLSIDITQLLRSNQSRRRDFQSLRAKFGEVIRFDQRALGVEGHEG